MRSSLTADLASSGPHTPPALAFNITGYPVWSGTDKGEGERGGGGEGGVCDEKDR